MQDKKESVKNSFIGMDEII